MDESLKTETPAVPHYAGFWIRAVAHFLDEMILLVGSLILTYVTLFVVYAISKGFQVAAPTSFSEAFSGGMIQMVNLLASLTISVPYYVAFTHLRGATPGKQVMGICVVDEETRQYPSIGQSFGRFAASILSALLFGAGYLMVAFNSKKKGLHDTIAGTISVHRDKRSEKPLDQPEA